MVYSKTSFTYKSREIEHADSNYFWQAVYDLALIVGEDIPKVYGIHPKTANSAWFKEAVEEGNWTNLADWVKENITKLPKDTIKKVSAYHHVTQNRIGTVTAGILSPLLVDSNGVAAKYFKEIADFSKYWDTKNIPATLSVEGWSHDEKDVETFKNMNGEVRKKYPLIFRVMNECAVINCNPNDVSSTLKNDMAKDLADYINMVDVYA